MIVGIETEAEEIEIVALETEIGTDITVIETEEDVVDLVVVEVVVVIEIDDEEAIVDVLDHHLQCVFSSHLVPKKRKTVL